MLESQEAPDHSSARRLPNADRLYSEDHDPTSDPHLAVEDPSNFLCLRCRQPGHTFALCSNAWFDEEYIVSDARRSMRFGEFSELRDQSLCQRCQSLDLVKFLSQDIPWDNMRPLTDAEVRKSGICRSIGRVDSTMFRGDCPSCRCLFVMTPTPSSKDQEILLMPSWTMSRLEGGISMSGPEKEHSARCLLVVLDPVDSSEPLAMAASRGEALCLVQEDYEDSRATLGGRCIDSLSLNTSTILEWLTACSKKHPITCKPTWTKNLERIHLIDVRSREVVRHPGAPCEYIALSYVWGGVEQQRFTIGPLLPQLPQTIQDAMALTSMLRRQYLWVDSICINQQDDREKGEQIAMMSSIYEGAFATIIAFSSPSATSGLPRLGSKIPMFTQPKCWIAGKRFVGILPTLSQLVWGSPWGNRAWTLQEALLSKRCIYVGDHQLIFECNSMQCSESLDESRSWVHQTYRDADFVMNRQSEALVGAGVLRVPFFDVATTTDRLYHYCILVMLYTYRELSFDADALNGFAGIIQYLTRLQYNGGFFWGMPVEDLNWALAWDVLPAHTKRRSGFPTWSWLAWKGQINTFYSDHHWKPQYQQNDRNPQYLQVYLKVWKAKSRELELLLTLPHSFNQGLASKSEGNPQTSSTFHALLDADCGESDFDLSALSSATLAFGLFIEGLVFPTAHHPDLAAIITGEREYTEATVAGVPCWLKIGLEVSSHDTPPSINPECVLLARDYQGDLEYVYLLVVDGDVIKTRRNVITVVMAKDVEQFWEGIGMQKKRFILI